MAKGQGALEYLLLIGGAFLIGVAVFAFLVGLSPPQEPDNYWGLSESGIKLYRPHHRDTTQQQKLQFYCLTGDISRCADMHGYDVNFFSFDLNPELKAYSEYWIITKRKDGRSGFDFGSIEMGELNHAESK